MVCLFMLDSVLSLKSNLKTSWDLRWCRCHRSSGISYGCQELGFKFWLLLALLRRPWVTATKKAWIITKAIPIAKTFFELFRPLSCSFILSSIGVPRSVCSNLCSSSLPVPEPAASCETLCYVCIHLRYRSITLPMLKQPALCHIMLLRSMIPTHCANSISGPHPKMSTIMHRSFTAHVVNSRAKSSRKEATLNPKPCCEGNLVEILWTTWSLACRVRVWVSKP